MNNAVNFEIPASVRQLAEKTVEQSKEAYERFIEAARQAQSMFASSGDVMGSGAKEIQDKAIQYAEANIQAGFDVAERLVKARDLKEILDIQATFARQQMETYTRQAQEITRLMAQAAQKAQPTV